MGRSTENFSAEQQELLDSGLRMLAQMIAETHIRRLASRKMSDDPVVATARTGHPEHLRKTPEDSSDDTQSENCHE